MPTIDPDIKAMPTPDLKPFLTTLTSAETFFIKFAKALDKISGEYNRLVKAEIDERLY